MNTKTAGKTVKEILDNIAPNKFVKKILSESGEIDQTMAKMVEKGKYHKLVENGLGKNWSHTKVANAIRTERFKSESFIKRSKLTPEQAKRYKKLLDNIDVDNYHETMASIRKLTSNEYFQEGVDFMEEGYNIFVDVFGEMSATIAPEKVKWMMNPINYYANIPRAYFSHPEYGTTRKVTAGVAVAGTVIGARYLSGGTLTEDSEGKKNIVGIPFI